MADGLARSQLELSVVQVRARALRLAKSTRVIIGSLWLTGSEEKDVVEHPGSR